MKQFNWWGRTISCHEATVWGGMQILAAQVPCRNKRVKKIDKLKNLLGFCLLLVLLSCERFQEKATFITSEVIAQNLIQICIDSTLQLDCGINSVKYLVDFEPVKRLHRGGIRKFLVAKHEACETNLDSLLRVASSISKYNFTLPATVIRFEKITIQNDGLLRIEISKTQSAEGFIIAELLFKPHGTNFQCLRSEITRIG